MDFIELTNPEYKQMMRNLRLRDPVEQMWKSFWVWLLFLLFWAFTWSIMYTENLPIGMREEGFFGPPQGMLHLAIASLSMVLMFWCVMTLLNMVISIPKLFTYDNPFVLFYFLHRRRFIKTVKALDARQHKKLLSEYPSRKKIDTYYDKRKRIAGSEKVYVTENFLFMPGLFLIARDELDELEVEKMDFDPDFSFHKMFATHNTIRFSVEETDNWLYLPLNYKFKQSPETAEQIFAWFWQCDPNDPKLPERVRDTIVKDDD